MQTISTRHLDGLPDIQSFRRLTRSLATLDAILSPEWEYRYYSFDSHWAPGEMMASMRNGSGDQWFALFCSAGVALHGLAHQALVYRPGSPPSGEFDELPPTFHENFLHEPAFETEYSTFCIWRCWNDDRWRRGPVRLPEGADPDGSEDLLHILSGETRQYVEFAAEYFDRQLAEADVAAVYRHEPLTAALVGRLNPDLQLAALAEDLEKIGYPESGEP